MPVQPCTVTVNGEQKPGRRWGKRGKCYPCKKDGNSWDCAEAHRKAEAQGKAIGEK